jgi:hypothetical protein
LALQRAEISCGWVGGAECLGLQAIHEMLSLQPVEGSRVVSANLVLIRKADEPCARLPGRSSPRIDIWDITLDFEGHHTALVSQVVKQ